jgi:hypothetical protein
MTRYKRKYDEDLEQLRRERALLPTTTIESGAAVDHSQLLQTIVRLIWRGGGETQKAPLNSDREHSSSSLIANK